MKQFSFLPTISIVALCLCALIAIFGCGGGASDIAKQQRDRDRRAIEAVFAKETAIETQVAQLFPQVASGNASDTDIVSAHKLLIDGLDAIDLSQCPHDFQDNYLRFRYAWQDWYSVQETYSGWLGKIGGIVEFQLEGVNPSKKIQTALARVKEARLEVVSTAMKHGVAEPK